MNVKNFLITLAIKGLIKLLEMAITAINNGTLCKSSKASDAAKDDSVKYDEDIEINPETAKLFAKFVKSHLKKGNEESEESK